MSPTFPQKMSPWTQTTCEQWRFKFGYLGILGHIGISFDVKNHFFHGFLDFFFDFRIVLSKTVLLVYVLTGCSHVYGEGSTLSEISTFVILGPVDKMSSLRNLKIYLASLGPFGGTLGPSDRNGEIFRCPLGTT